MAYPRKLLGKEEEVVEDLRPHWWFLVRGMVPLVLVIALGVFLLVIDAHPAFKWPSGVLVLIALGYFTIVYLRWVTTNFVVTTDRVIYRHGVLSKHGIEIPLERINTVFFNQGVFERMIKAGDLAIESAGETGRSEFSDIRHPSDVQAEIYQQMEDNENRKFDRINRPGVPQQSIPEQIDHLDDLRRRGVVSQAEFEAKKAELLGRM